MIWNKISEYGILNNADSKYLYRGLREDKIDTGIKLIPNGIANIIDTSFLEWYTKNNG